MAEVKTSYEANNYDISQLTLADDLNLYLEAENKIFAFCQSVNLDISADQISADSKFSGAWSVALQGKGSYTISADALFVDQTGKYNYDALLDAFLKRAPIDFKIGRATDHENWALDTTKNHYSGKAVITSLNLSASNNEVAQVSVTFTGAGALEKVAGVPGGIGA